MESESLINNGLEIIRRELEVKMDKDRFLTKGINFKGENSKLYKYKFIAALLVIFSHSFSLVGKEDWLYNITKGQMSFGGLSVGLFLFFSGLYISKSISQNSNITFCNFMKKRCIRIFPALFVTIFLTVFGLGPIMTTLSLKDYFLNIETYRYLLNVLLIMQHNLPGVFENNIAMATVNGALWTLPVEFLCYIGCFILKKMGFYEKKRYSISYFILYILWILVLVTIDNGIIIRALRAGMFFATGIYTYIFKDKIHINKVLTIIAFVILAFSSIYPIWNICIIILFPYFLILCLFVKNSDKKKNNQFMSNMGKKYSYTIYLCGVPIQQSIIAFHGGNMNNYLNFIEASTISCVCGVIISYLSEKILGLCCKKNK